jgi:hypothetical protein
VFERFYRIADHAPITGTGLGLPIARDLARAMGGELEVASISGIGSSFVLVLPGPAGAIPAAAMAAATRTALASEMEHLRTLGLLRAGGGAADSGRGVSGGPAGDDPGDRPIGTRGTDQHGDPPGDAHGRAPLPAGFRR